MAVCGMQSVDLTRYAIKILGIYFSCNMNLMNKKKYCQPVTNISGILKLWSMRNLSIEDNIIVFKTLAISKLMYLARLTIILKHYWRRSKKKNKNLSYGIVRLLKLIMKH